MKKIISLLLVLVLCVGILSTAAFAEEEEKSDIIEFDYSKIAQSASEKLAFLESLTDESMLPEDPFSFIHISTTKSKDGLFTLTATFADKDGWYCGGSGDSSFPFTITAADGLKITRIEAEIGYHAESYDGVGVSGNASKQPIFERNGIEMASITNINSSEFSISGGTDTIQLKDITVYYTGTHTHSYGDDGKCSCGRTKCEVEGHSLENGFCKFCDYFDETKHAHDYQPTVYTCQSCGEEAPAGYVPEVPGGSTGSTLSQGNMTIVCSIASLAVGMAVMFFIMKKKPAVASGANSENEE